MVKTATAVLGPVFSFGVLLACSGSTVDSIPAAGEVDASSSSTSQGDAGAVVCTPGASCTRTDCSDGTCDCAANTQCELTCASPPCHATCLAGSTCSATCANGDCSCGEGATCSFGCASPPCHVECAGNNPRCDGVCANGTCACGPHSACHFSCAGGPCHVQCAAGASCVVDCTQGGAGTQNCDFSACAAGTPVICAGGVATTCGAACP